MKRGRFITLEGGEGAGKSTQAELLARALGEAGFTVVATREPGGTPLAEELRRVLLDARSAARDAMIDALLHTAARLDHWTRVIDPALGRGAWVVCDRFADSTLAYQGHGQGIDVAHVRDLHRLVLGAVAPDLTVVLDLPVAVGLARARERGRADRYEAMDAGFHQRLRDGFLAIARAEPARCAVVDATGDPTEVHARILATVRERTGAW